MYVDLTKDPHVELRGDDEGKEREGVVGWEQCQALHSYPIPPVRVLCQQWPHRCCEPCGECHRLVPDT